MSVRPSRLIIDLTNSPAGRTDFCLFLTQSLQVAALKRHVCRIDQQGYPRLLDILLYRQLLICRLDNVFRPLYVDFIFHLRLLR